jgi:hypothetical protein
VTIGTRDVLLILHSGPAATLTSLDPAHSLKHAPPPPLYRELRGWKRGVEPKGNNEMSVHTRSYCNKERNYESERCAHLVPLPLSAPSRAPPKLPHLRHLDRGRINCSGSCKACGLDLVTCRLDPCLHTQPTPRSMTPSSVADLMPRFGTY